MYCMYVHVGTGQLIIGHMLMASCDLASSRAGVRVCTCVRTCTYIVHIRIFYMYTYVHMYILQSTRARTQRPLEVLSTRGWYCAYGG